VRRLLDIVACTSSFGPAPPKDTTSATADAPTATGGGAKESKKSTTGSNDGGGSRKSSPPPAQKDSKEKEALTDLEAEMSGACPRLGAFYEFFSLANLTPPLHCKLYFLLVFLKCALVTKYDFSVSFCKL
jgi:protein TIF31